MKRTKKYNKPIFRINKIIHYKKITIILITFYILK